MKTLSLIQPYASMIFLGHKRIETRSWKTSYRGELYIHTSKVLDKKVCLNEPFSSIINENFSSIKDIPTSQIIGKCNLVDCIEMTTENIKQLPYLERSLGIYSPGRYMWVLDDIEPIKPLSIKGSLGIWNVDLNKVQQLEKSNIQLDLFEFVTSTNTA